MKASLRALVLWSCVSACPGVSLADGEPARQLPREPGPNVASDASFDKRLPPVLPGEEVRDGSGKMKVWSTAGGVSASRPPDPFAAPAPSGYSAPGYGAPGYGAPGYGAPGGDVDVVIDGREFVRDRRDDHHDRSRDHEHNRHNDHPGDSDRFGDGDRPRDADRSDGYRNSDSHRGRGR